MILELLAFVALKGSLYAYQSYHNSSTQEVHNEQIGEGNPKTCIEALGEAVQEVKEESISDGNAVSSLEKKSVPCPAVDENLLDAVVERIRSEIPELMKELDKTPSGKVVNETLDTVYRSQIAAAQEFLNENRSADLSRVKCLLHKLLPREYFDYIEQLREHQDPQTIIHIMGGQNVIAPNANEASQSFRGKKDPKKGPKKRSQHSSPSI